jgi:uncharacterized protein involved in exopolysaccharide biosynthesis
MSLSARPYQTSPVFLYTRANLFDPSGRPERHLTMASTKTQAPPRMHEIPPLEALDRLWRRKYWVLAIVCTSLLLSALYLQQARKLYEIQANLLLESNAHGLRFDNRENSRPDAELIATQSEILASRHLLGLAVEAQHDLVEEKSLHPEELITRLREELSVKRLVGTRILNISLRWDDCEQGEAFVQSLLAQYERFLLELNQGGQVEALETLAQTESEIRSELTTLQAQYRALRKESSLVGDGDAGLAPQQRLLAEFGAAYAEVRGRRIGLENRLAAIKEPPTDSNVAGRGTPSESGLASAATESTQHDNAVINAGYTSFHRPVPTADLTERGWGALQILSGVDLKGLQDPIAIQQELFQAEVRRQELVEKYLENHPEVRAVESQIADLKKRLQTLVERVPLILEREVRASLLQEERLRKLYEEELETVRKLDQHRLEQSHLANEIDQIQILHNSVLTQLSELRLNNRVTTEGAADLRVRILDPPKPSLSPAWPNKKLVLGGGVLMGLLGSSMLVLIPVPYSESRDRKSQSQRGN